MIIIRPDANVCSCDALALAHAGTHVPMVAAVAMYRLQPSSQHSVSRTVTYCKTY